MGANKITNFLRKYMMLIAMVIVIIVFAVITDGKTLYPINITSLISQNAYVFVLGTGMLLCILTGGNIDLSVGSVVCLAGGVGAIMMTKNIPWPVAVIVMLIMGLLVGLWHGFWIAYVKVPPFIATLVGMLAFRGLANIIMGGYAYDISDKGFLNVFGGGNSCYIPGSYIPDKLGVVKAALTNYRITGEFTLDAGKLQGTVDALQKTVDAGKDDVVNKIAASIDGITVEQYLANVDKQLSSLKMNLTAQLNVTCLIVGLLIAVGFVVFTVINRKRLIKKGYKVAPLGSVIIKTVIIFAVILWTAYKLAGYKGIPTALIWIALILGLFAYITTKTTLGRNLYAVGGNEKATRLSGIDTRKVMFSAYTLMGVLSGFAGVLNIARLSGSTPTYGVGFEMDAIAACFIGGASAYGGTGSIGGVIIGAALMGIINQGMSIADTPVNYQKVVKGIVLIVAVLFDVIMQMRRKGAKKKKLKKKLKNVVSTEKGGANV